MKETSRRRRPNRTAVRIKELVIVIGNLCCSFEQKQERNTIICGCELRNNNINSLTYKHVDLALELLSTTVAFLLFERSKNGHLNFHHLAWIDGPFSWRTCVKRATLAWYLIFSPPLKLLRKTISKKSQKLYFLLVNYSSNNFIAFSVSDHAVIARV